MFFITVTDVINFADDTTMHSCLATYNEANLKLTNLNIYTFELVQNIINRMVANSGNFR